MWYNGWDMQHTLRFGYARFATIARSHDDIPAFVAVYWLLTLMAAMLFNAGAFALLVGMHMALDVYKYRDVHGRSWRKVCEGVFRESLLDISVLTLGIAFSVYCHVALPIFAGLRGIVQTEIAIINAVVQVTVKTHVLHGFLTIIANIHDYLQGMHPRMGKGLTLVEVVAVIGLIVSLSLTLASPWVLGLTPDQTMRLAGDILVPWKL